MTTAENAVRFQGGTAVVDLPPPIYSTAEHALTGASAAARAPGSKTGLFKSAGFPFPPTAGSAPSRAARPNGLGRDEIKEILLQTAIYCGVPSANKAFKTAQQVFKEMDSNS